MLTTTSWELYSLKQARMLGGEMLPQLLGEQEWTCIYTGHEMLYTRFLHVLLTFGSRLLLLSYDK